MTSNSKMKQITLEKLDDSASKATTAKIKQIAVFALIVLAAGVGGYFVYGMLSGPTVASRFTVNNMNCPACVITVKEVTSKMPGVLETDVSLSSQSVTVTFQENRIKPENIGQAIAHVGYQVKLDEAYNRDFAASNGLVVAGVNGKPIFSSDINLPLTVSPDEFRKRDVHESFFSSVGKELILQAADRAVIVAQPSEVEDEIRTILETQTMKEEDFTKWINENFGSMEKFKQVIAQRLAIQKFIDESEISEIQDREMRKDKILEMLGNLLKDADVKIYDKKLKENIHAKIGQDNWKTFWPRMLSVETELKSLLLGRGSTLETHAATETAAQN